jgi:dUTP pyrophosphatase
VEIEVRILDDRLKRWGFPSYGSAQAAGMDLFACVASEVRLRPQAQPVLVPTGVAIHIADPDWCAVIAPRSGLGHKGLVLGNLVGVVDADYTGECLVSAWNRNIVAPDDNEDPEILIRPGDRIAQLVIVRIARPDWLVVNEFSRPSDRGSKGFGSTDK